MGINLPSSCGIVKIRDSKCKAYATVPGTQQVPNKCTIINMPIPTVGLYESLIDF